MVQVLSSSQDLTHFLHLQLVCVGIPSWKLDLAASISLTLWRKAWHWVKSYYVQKPPITLTAATQILYTFVFIYWNIRTKLTNPVSERINSRTFQLRLSVQSSPSHRCYNFKMPDQKLLDRTAAVTGNTKWNESVFLFFFFYFSLGILTSQEKTVFISIFNSLIKSRILLKVFHVCLLLWRSWREKEGKEKKKKRENKPYYFQPKITTHAIPKTSLMIHFIL